VEAGNSNVKTGGINMARKRKRSPKKRVRVKGYYRKVGNKRIRVKGYTRKK